MATVTKTIKASGGDYSSFTAWAADLDNTTPYDAGDDAIGEAYDFISEASEVQIILGDTIGLNSISLTSDPGSRHDGTPSGAAGINYTGSGDENVLEITVPNIDVDVTWLEFDGNHDDPSHLIYWEKGTGGNTTSDRGAWNLAYRSTGTKVRGATALGNRGFATSALGNRCHNNFFFDIQGTVQSSFGAIFDTNGGTESHVYNNTLFNINHTHSARNAYAINTLDDADKTYKNNLALDVTNSGGGTAACYNPSMEFSTGTSATNGSNDSTGSSGLTSLGNSEIVSSTTGFEDLHLASGSTSEDAGTDAGTTPAGVEIDINGDDRTAAGTWDIGAHEFELGGPDKALPPSYRDRRNFQNHMVTR